MMTQTMYEHLLPYLDTDAAFEAGFHAMIVDPAVVSISGYDENYGTVRYDEETGSIEFRAWLRARGYEAAARKAQAMFGVQAGDKPAVIRTNRGIYCVTFHAAAESAIAA